MIWISWLASYLSDPWVLGTWAVVMLVYGWTCLPYREPTRDHIGELLIDDIGALARMKAGK